MTTSEFKCTGGVWLTQLVRVEVGSRGQISNSKADLCNACDLRAAGLASCALLYRASGRVKQAQASVRAATVAVLAAATG